MPADALWTFAMACNVYLTFFHKYNSEQLRHLEWKYVLCCYGVPFIPAFAYFFIQTQARGHVYGSAIVSTPKTPTLPLPVFADSTTSITAMVLDICTMGLPSYRRFLRASLVRHILDLRHLPTSGDGDLPETTSAS